MVATAATSVQELVLDLKNFRTVAQANEIEAIQAMISISPDKFWALAESLIDDGYHPTENIIVLISSEDSSQMIVKEGNRRVGALKIIHGYLSRDYFPIPKNILEKINNISPEWKVHNEHVPCAIYPAVDAARVDRVVTLAHGKGEKAGRDKWSAVARARHNRDANKAQESALDILEKYILHSENVSKAEVKKWAGDFPLTVLDEAMPRLAIKFDLASGSELAKKYPKIENKAVLDEIIRDVGVEVITFKVLRGKEDFLSKYDIERTNKNELSGAGPANNDQQDERANSGGEDVFSGQANSTGNSEALNIGGEEMGAGSQATSSNVRKVAAVAIDDPKAVLRTLKKFVPRGQGRQKVVTLLSEAKILNLEKNPIAFCFLLRSMFEISAKAYCDDHAQSGGPSATKAGGDERSLVHILRDITAHLTMENSDKAMVKLLHGAITELARGDGLLSVSSMNQLVHNPSFSIASRDIAILFGNVFPLLQAMNE